MPDKTWKAHERKVAKAVGGIRTPLSGSASQQTSADVIHPWLFVEVKCRKQFAVVSQMKDVEARAKKESKTPALVLHQAGDRFRYWLFREDFAIGLLKAYQASLGKEERIA